MNYVSDFVFFVLKDGNKRKRNIYVWWLLVLLLTKKQKKVVVVREYGDVFDPNGKYVRYVLSKNSIRTDYRNS